MSFLITRLSGQSQSFLTQFISSGKSRNRVATIALARMIAANFTLPSSPVESVEDHYLVQCQLMASKIISEINELVPVDIKATQDMCRSFYMYRYLNAHPEKAVFAFVPESAVADFFGISKYFSNDTLKTLQDEAATLTFFANGLRDIVRDLRAGEEAAAMAQGGV